MNNVEIKEFLINNLPGAKLVSGGKEILVRCPICGDSRNPRSAHFYIGIGDDNSPPMYHCKKCDEGGVFSFEKLRMFDIYDSKFGLALNNHIKSLGNKIGSKLNLYDGRFNISNSRISNNMLSIAKLKYINSRLGLNLSFEDILSQKILLNLSDLMIENNITQYTRKEYIMDILDRDFIGFISYDNGFLNMRNIHDYLLSNGYIINDNNVFTDKRYINYNIFNKVDNSKRYYILPGEVDLLNPEKIKIHIAEGPFDILGIYYNVVQTKYNNIFASIGGKSYMNIIKFFLGNLGLMNVEFHIYADSDIEDYVMINLKEFLKPFGISIYVHRNRYVTSKGFGGIEYYEKDYGVPKERIVDTIQRI